MDVFAFDNYKNLVRAWIQTQPKNGYGQLRKIAEYLGVGSVFISQVFKADRDLTEDQAHQLTKYMGFIQLEKEYFILLVQFARAETHEFQKFLQTKIESLQRHSKKLKNRVDTDRELSELEKAKFYSDWLYSGLRNLAAIPGQGDTRKLAERLDLPLNVIQEAVDFLVETGLCRLNSGKVEVGSKITWLEESSPYIKTRQIHWRMKAIESMNHNSASHLFYTCPMSLSLKTKQEIRDKLLKFIQELMKDVRESPSEDVACLNIDWFGF